MSKNLKLKHLDAMFLKDCQTIIQLFKQKTDLITKLNLQLEFEYKMYRNKVVNNGDFPYRFRKALQFLIDYGVIIDKDSYLTLDNKRLSDFFEQLTKEY